MVMLFAGYVKKRIYLRKYLQICVAYIEPILVMLNWEKETYHWKI